MGAPTRPRLRNNVTIVPDGDDLQIRSLKQFLVLSGRSVKEILVEVLPLLDGTHPVEELQQRLHQHPGLMKVLSALQQAGIIDDASEDRAQTGTESFQRVCAFLEGLGGAEDSATQIAKARLSVWTEPESAELIIGRLATLGLTGVTFHAMGPGSDLAAAIMAPVQDSEETGAAHRLTGAVAGTDLVLFATQSWNPAVALAINNACMTAGVAWVGLQAVSEAEFVLGPAVIPGQSACYQCAETRRRSNWLEVSTREAAYDHFASTGVVNFGPRIPSPLWGAAVDLLSVEALKLISGNTFFAQTINQAVRFRPFTMELEHHRILRVPRCPHCGLAKNRPPVRAWMA